MHDSLAEEPARPGAVAEPSARASAAKERIAKAMARAGLCSRRDAEAVIAAGRVAINGKTITSPAVTVTTNDRVVVDGKPLPRRERTRLFLYHKPSGLVSTNADPQGRPTLFDDLPGNLPRLVSVGRLDIGTEGLLLLTNDGGLARVLELPQTQWMRRYRVRAHGRVKPADLEALRGGITIDGIHYGPIEASLEREQGSNVWLAFAIREGKNREVRNVLTHLGLLVNRLIRIEFGPFGLGDLAPGAIEEVPTPVLRQELGDTVIGRAGCDFSGPATERPAAPAAAPRRGREPRSIGASRDARAKDAPRAPARPRGEGLRDDRRQRPVAGKSRTFAPGGASGAREEKPRPRRGHAWRADDAPLRRHYRGSRPAALKIDDEARPDKRAGLLTDRNGRRILVERFGTQKPQEELPERPRPPRRAPRPPPRDRAAGPRPSQPKLPHSKPPGSKLLPGSKLPGSKPPRPPGRPGGRRRPHER